MTADAEIVTRRAMSAGVPMQPAGHLRGYSDALARIGFDTDALLALAAVPRSVLDDPDGLVPCTALDVVYRGALAERRIPNLAAHLGWNLAMGTFPLLDYLVLSTDTVGDALRQLQRYFYLTGSPGALEIAEDADGVRLIVEPGTDVFCVQLSVAILIHHLRDETEQRLHVSHVSLMREPEDRRDLERLFGCVVSAPATWSGVEFLRATLAVRMRRRDPVLRRVLEGKSTSTHVSALASSADGLIPRLRALVVSRLGHGVPDIAEASRQLAMAPRTLQRHLAAEGASFKELIDVTRREAAERLLSDRSLAVSEVGYVLGFSEPSAFHRAFRRWHGMTPQKYRADHWLSNETLPSSRAASSRTR